MLATADSITRYLGDCAEKLSINTLRHRLAALAQWHIDQGFPDPTKAPIVRKVFRGIRALYSVKEKQAEPLQLAELEKIVVWLDAAIFQPAQHKDRKTELRHIRDKALVLVGFWRRFRGHELTRLRVEHIDVTPGEGLRCYLPHTKADRQYRDTTFSAPALSKLCPVDAYVTWIAAVHLTGGPVFHGIDRWWNITDKGLHPDSLIPLLRAIFVEAGIVPADRYSGHSLRRGFASWPTFNGMGPQDSDGVCGLEERPVCYAICGSSRSVRKAPD